MPLKSVIRNYWPIGALAIDLFRVATDFFWNTPAIGAISFVVSKLSLTIV